MQALGLGPPDSSGSGGGPNATLSAALAALASVQQQQQQGDTGPGPPSTNGAHSSRAPRGDTAPKAEGHEANGSSTAGAAAEGLQLGSGGAFKPPAASGSR